MSETVEAPNETETAAPAKKKGKLLIMLLLALLLLGGGGAGAYFFFMGGSDEAAEEESAEAGEESAPEEEKPKPKKAASKKAAYEEEDEEEEEESAGGKKNPVKQAIPKDEGVTEIVELQPFIVNLADSESPRYLRMTVNLGIGGEEGGGHEKPSPLFLTRVKNAMLAVLTNKTSEDVLSAEGKAKLRRELLKAARAASEHPHVEAVYITDFIVQL